MAMRKRSRGNIPMAGTAIASGISIHAAICSDVLNTITDLLGRWSTHIRQALGKKKKKFFQDFHGIVSGAQGEKDFFSFFCEICL
jgi:hypothetical protein